MGKLGKRDNGDGSIFFVQGRGWRAQKLLIRPDGSKERVSKTYELKGEAKRWLDQQNENQRKGIVTAPDKLTVETCLTNWLRDTIAPMDEPNTYEYYEYPVRVHLIPAIGKIKLNDLRPEHVRKLLNDRREQYSKRTIQAIHATLKAALNQQVKDEVLERNVAALVKTADAKQVTEEHATFVTLTAEQSATFLEAMERHGWRSFMVVTMMLGIRRGETLALRWPEVDFEGGWISLVASIVRVRVRRLKVQPTSRFSGAGSRLNPLKSGSKSRRSLEMSPFVRAALVEQQERQRVQREKAGDQWREQGFVFTSEFGDNFHPDTATAAFAELRTEAKLPLAVHLHSLRHSLASAMLKAKVHPKVVQEQLGHSRIQITLDKYSHLIPGEKTEVGSAMEAFIASGKVARAATKAAEQAAQLDVRELERMFEQNGEEQAGKCPR